MLFRASIAFEYRMKKTGQKNPTSELEGHDTQYSGSRNVSRAKALVASGYSQAEIAEKLGVSQSTVSEYING